ncbi:MAG: glucosaminidase domain-containing protein [Bacilli bacterium]|nr:glucosaminidase domain-containing protein [Bacilli bacterium]
MKLSSDSKKILLALFFVIDCLLVTLIFKANDNSKVSLESQSTNMKSMANKYEEINKKVDLVEEEVVLEQQPVIVYDNLTYDELVAKLNNNLNDDLAGKGEVIASKSLELGVDPYMVTAIMLQETGCKWSCSQLVKACNNVGGQKGYGCGSYSYFNTLDEGIEAMISNIYYNYYTRGMTTPETINPVYAESQTWSYNVNRYIEEIRNN